MIDTAEPVGSFDWHYEYDGAGSVRQITHASANVLTSQTFDPYGTPYS